MSLVITAPPHEIAVMAARLSIKASKRLNEPPNPDMVAIVEAAERFAAEAKPATSE
jgi:hypothetical protein